MNATIEKAKQARAKIQAGVTPRRTQAAVLAFAVLVVTFGLAFGAGVQSQSETIADQRAEVTDLNDDLYRLEVELEDSEDELARTKSAHRSQMDSLRTDQSERERELDELAAELAAREEAVTTSETAQAAREFQGGMVIVGDQVEAGTYRSGGTGSLGGCYWEWLSSTESDASIIDNGLIMEGTTTVTLRDGDIFTSQSCGTWTRTD